MKRLVSFRTKGIFARIGHARADDQRRAAPICLCDKTRDFLGQMLPVAVEHQHVKETPRGKLAQAGLDRGAFPLVLLVPDNFGPGFARLLRGAVRGTVVDDQHMVQLGQGAPGHGLDMGLLVIRRDQRSHVGPVSRGHHVVAG